MRGELLFCISSNSLTISRLLSLANNWLWLSAFLFVMLVKQRVDRKIEHSHGIPINSVELFFLP